MYAYIILDNKYDGLTLDWLKLASLIGAVNFIFSMKGIIGQI